MTFNHSLQSENISDLVAALSKAQGEIESASFDKKNPHFKSNYASYDAIREVCKKPLTVNNLSITHLLDSEEGKRLLITQLSHSSGQWMRSFVLIPQEKETPQSMGSAITYSKRYALSALLAIGTNDDDDGEKAEELYRKEENLKISEQQKQEIMALCDGDMEIINRILKAYDVTNLLAISSSEFPLIIKRLKLTKEKSNENTGS